MNPKLIRIEAVKDGYNRGWSYIGLNGKVPRREEKGWTKAKRKTLERSVELAERINVGIRTGKASGGLVVVDIDNGADVSDLDLPDTVTVLTGSGGRHLYYHSDKPIKNSVSKLSHNVDIRGDGGQVVAVGSIHPKTRQMYKYIVAPNERKIAPLPDWIAEKLKPARKPIPKTNTANSAYVEAAIRNEQENVRLAREGTRNNTLNIAAFSLAQFIPLNLLSEDEIETILLAATDIPAAEAIPTIRSGVASGREKPRIIPDDFEAITPESEKVLADASVMVIGTHQTPTGKKEIGSHVFSHDVLKNLPAGAVYRRAGVIVELVGTAGKRRLEPVSPDRMRIITDSFIRLALYKKIKSKKDGKTYFVSDFKPATRDHGKLILEAAAHDNRIKEIDYLTNYPVYTRTFDLTKAGLHHGIYYDEPDELSDLIPEPENCIDILDDLITDFPFDSDEDKLNFICLLLTPLVRPALIGNVPMFLIMSSMPRTGKTKLGEEVVGGTYEGEHTPAMQLTGSEDERDKRILSMLIAGDTIVHIDNVSDYLDSPSLASLVTAKKYRGRLLGSSRVVDVNVNLTIIASGNNPKASNELVKRSVPIRLQPKTDHPETRTDFAHPNIFEYVLNNRRRIMAALAGMVEVWKKKGQKRSKKRMGGFETWAEVVGGVMEANGLKGWLDNWQAFVDAADPEAEDLRDFVSAWSDHYPVNLSIGASDLYQLAEENELFEGLLSRSTTDRGKQTIFGMKVLSKYQNAPVGKYIIRKGSRNKYHLELNQERSNNAE